ncbi:MAG TPA: 50S ribosomal protein L10 [candidate division Zixibacteria bacterium]|nr:50S ribosomal protein L10 [candidate division Zixibacteria bacterium]
MPRQDKIDAVAKYGELFKESNAFFVTDYQGLNVADITALRKKLRESNVRFLIGKNTLFSIAAREANIEGLDQYLEGPTAIAFTSEDPAVAAKILNESFKDKELPKMRVFSLEEELHAGKEIGRLADLPSKEILYAQLAAAVGAPLTNLAGALSGLFRKLTGVLMSLEEQKKNEG